MSNFIKGMDTSKYQQSKVDFNQAKREGYSFVILRIGYSKTKDPCFEKDYARAAAAGMKIGVYFYTMSTTEAEAKYDASRVLGWLNGRKLDMPVCYDLEDAKQKNESRKSLNSKMYNAFASVIKASGYDSMLYTGEYYYNHYFNKSAITDKLWIAKYSSTKPSVGRDIEMWQYTSENCTGFYNGKLDRNYWYTSLEKAACPKTNPYPVPTRTLKKALVTMSGDDVMWLQWELVERGFLDRNNSKGKSNIDGKFGSLTEGALRRYQSSVGYLSVDGKCGPATRAALLKK